MVIALCYMLNTILYIEPYILAGITLFVALILYVKSNKIIIRKNNK